MKTHKEIIIGSFVVIVILGSFFLINYLKGSNIFQKYYNFYSVFESVEGITPSTPVYIKGFKAGTMQSIEYLKESQNYKICYNVRGDFDIPQDSYCEIFSSDILGGKALRIITGESAQLLKNGSEMKCQIQEDMLGGLISGIGPVKDEVNLLLKNLNESVSKINSILDEDTQTSIRSIVSDLESSIRDIRMLAANVNAKTPQITGIISNMDSISAKINTTADILFSSMQNIDDITRDLKEAELKESIQSFRDLLEQIKNPEGSIGKLLSTDSLHNSINSLTRDLDSLIKKMERNPKKYMRISVF